MKSIGYITLAEAEQLSGIRSDTLKKRCQEGKIPGAIKQGKTWFVPRSEILRNEIPAIDDRLLAMLATIAEAGVGLSITLIVGGAFISGELIPMKKYLEMVQANLKRDAKGENAPEFIEKLFDPMFDSLLKTQPKNLTEAVDKQINYLHIAKSEVWASGQQSNGDENPLRIKLSAVDGFMWGRHSSPVDEN